ncbi:MAG: hypothetical protein M1832_000749 [Thelocarpon impressellum]|nr:MAG: hypothetical protein M1832_000749 [Thelocarpon impressellum]
MAFLLRFFHSQLFIKLPYPETDFGGQTVVVTGANTGLGLEAARHFTRLNATTVILGVRNAEKGEAARAAIEATTGKKGVVEVWPLDLSSYESVKQFAARAQGLGRLDAVVENAGIAANVFRLAEGDEATITVNVTSTFLLALLLLPKLRQTAAQYDVLPRLTIVSSEVHAIAAFAERKHPDLFAALSDPARTDMDDRYNVSKLLEVLAVRELAGALAASPRGGRTVVLDTVNPGLCHSELGRDAAGARGMIFTVMKALLARSTEVGSRTLISAASAGWEGHGQYFSDCKVAAPSPYVLSPEGQDMQRRVWVELGEKLERIQPGILGNI